MPQRPDSLAAYADAVRAGDHRLAALIAQRLFPWVRGRSRPAELPAAAHRVVERLRERLGL
jgi:hypothetical protein